MTSLTNKILKFLRPDRYLLAGTAFLILFPAFIGFIAPDTGYGYAYGKIGPGGNEIYTIEGGNTFQYQWYYPLLYPFMVIWYVAIIPFSLADNCLPINLFGFYSSLLFVYYYLISATAAIPIRKLYFHKKAKGGGWD